MNKRCKFYITLLCILMILMAAGQSYLNHEFYNFHDTTFAFLHEQIKNDMLSVDKFHQDIYRYIGATTIIRKGKTGCAGVVIDDYHVVTCRHITAVRKGKLKIQIDTDEFIKPLEVIYLDGMDVILLKSPVNLLEAGFTKVEIADTVPSISSIVYHVGHPYSVRHRVSKGIVSKYPGNCILSDIFIGPGSSGGGLFTKNGKLIGIATSLLRTKKGYVCNFAHFYNVTTLKEIILEKINEENLSRLR